MVILKSDREIQKMVVSNRIVAETMCKLAKMVKPGVTTIELDTFAEEYILSKGAKPAFKGYRGFPATICVSVNEEIVHGIPGSKVLQEGDIVSIDMGVLKDGYYGDSAATFPVGQVSHQATKLIETTRETLMKAIDKSRVGNRLSDISYAVQSHAENMGFSVVRYFVGHGIGRSLHEEPKIPNYGPPGRGPRLREGMVLALEPMVNEGTYQVHILTDNWTAVTQDGSLSAHFEHTVAITANGPRILSVLDEDVSVALVNGKKGESVSNIWEL